MSNKIEELNNNGELKIINGNDNNFYLSPNELKKIIVEINRGDRWEPDYVKYNLYDILNDYLKSKWYEI